MTSHCEKMMTSEPTMTDRTIEMTGSAAIAPGAAQLTGHAALPASPLAVATGRAVVARPPTGRHEQADVVLVGGPAVAQADQLAAVDDGDPVGQLEDLVELRRDEQDGRPGVALGDGLLVDELDAADVEAASRLVEDEQAQVAAELARDDDLLLVAAGQRRRLRVGRRASGCRTP